MSCKRKRQDKEEMAEKYCFMCKDSGSDLHICDSSYEDGGDDPVIKKRPQNSLEDECKDLISLAEEGLLKRATVAELEEKVATVHTDKVNHWIERELLKLERKIDFAQLKGLHREMVKLLKQKNLLNRPSERQRRLEEIPKVLPDTKYKEKETEVHVAASNSSQENRGAAHQVVHSLNVLKRESSKGMIEMYFSFWEQADATPEEVDLGVDWSQKTGGSAPSPGTAEDKGVEVPVKGTPVVAASCMDAEARPSPAAPVASGGCVGVAGTSVPAAGASVGDPEAWAEPASDAALQPAALRRGEELSAELGRRLESERDAAALAAVEETARLLAQLEELRQGKAASDAAAQGTCWI